MSPLFIEHLDIVTQNIETNFSSVKRPLLIVPITLDNATNFFPKICSAGVIIRSNMDEKRLDGQQILWVIGIL